MYDISKERKIEFIKIGENRNLIRLSTAYDTNCSECDYVEVNDETLEYMLSSEKEMASKNRNYRGNTIPYPEQDKDINQIGLITCSAEDYFFNEHNNEEAQEILNVLSLLTDCQRRRIFLYFRLKLTYKEIGKRENVSIGTVQSSIKLALEKLWEYRHFLQNVNIIRWLDLLI